jgi:hypothetical protein
MVPECTLQATAACGWVHVPLLSSRACTLAVADQSASNQLKIGGKIVEVSHETLDSHVKDEFEESRLSI